MQLLRLLFQDTRTIPYRWAPLGRRGHGGQDFPACFGE